VNKGKRETKVKGERRKDRSGEVGKVRSKRLKECEK